MLCCCRIQQRLLLPDITRCFLLLRCRRCCLRLLQLASQSLDVELLLVHHDLSRSQLWCQL